MTEYWAAVYAREKSYGGSELRWRIRDMKNHPCDPGWERGDCSVCHRPMRERAEAGDILFDIVFPKGAKSNAPRVVRSAMPIARAESGELQFDLYIFLDGNWRDGIAASEGETESWLDGAPLWRGRGTLSEQTAIEWLETMTDAEAYSTYTAGQRPQSVPEEYWEDMIGMSPLSSAKMAAKECSSPQSGEKCNWKSISQSRKC